MYKVHQYIDLSAVQTKLPQEVLELLTCNICLGIAIEACQCSKCQGVFCSKEINELPDRLCPICRVSEWKPFESIHKSLKTMLRILEVECCTCKNAIPYKQYIGHIQKCDPKPIKEEKKPDIYFDFYFVADEQNVQYDLLSIVSMNVNLREGIKQFRLGVYHIDLEELIQTNTRSNFKREIIQQQQKAHIEQAYWLYSMPENSNTAFEYELQVPITEAYERWLEHKKVAQHNQVYVNSDEQNLCINFSNMTATDIDSQLTMQIRRCLI